MLQPYTRIQLYILRKQPKLSANLRCAANWRVRSISDNAPRFSPFSTSRPVIAYIGAFGACHIGVFISKQPRKFTTHTHFPDRFFKNGDCDATEREMLVDLLSPQCAINLFPGHTILLCRQFGRSFMRLQRGGRIDTRATNYDCFWRVAAIRAVCIWPEWVQATLQIADPPSLDFLGEAVYSSFTKSATDIIIPATFTNILQTQQSLGTAQITIPSYDMLLLTVPHAQSNIFLTYILAIGLSFFEITMQR